MNTTHLKIVGERRAGIQAKAAAMGVDEAYVSELVNAFYSRIREDRLLGPIFDEAIGDRWGLHLEKMKDFWATVALGAGRYSGEPIPAHKKLVEVRPRHFDEWLELFEETLQDTAPTPEAAAYFMGHARQIGRGLQIAMFGASGFGRAGA
ncbi:MAG: group III truncated hemoglobin [Nitrospinae bacterium]|nr:group III truncated hemoglobin [Nitrospinota bacterium]